VESGQQYCATGFPMGCYVDKNGSPKDACVISREYINADHFYIFNHVDIVVSYHSGKNEEWGNFLQKEEAGGRIVCKLLILICTSRLYSHAATFQR
jgi:transmembrane 9 superfamily protein 2/4